ncbi:LysR family transcriptional regulator [Roseomonas populi]|uniref:LysR family transcriptional regulator n=1 Tax=Roseomonas populi TaxID=3121582 RepID=A0ABT1XAL6_9PROT|nr:LysR family transcriptional regulator [Roseomonas pecuniae]MCR0985139.1 LysR family transcriptional regulator [Roseomonas pecuniae]
MADDLPPLASLRAFVLVAETGSLSAAAARLNVTQPAISKRLRELEARLGEPLLRRGANLVRPTEAGAAYASALSEAFARIRAATAALPGQARPIRVLAYTTWALRWLIPRIPHFRAEHPGLEVEVSTSTDARAIAEAPADVAVRTAPADHPPVPGAIRLQPVLLTPFATPALARAQPLSAMRLLASRIRPNDWAQWQAAHGLEPGAPPLVFESTTLAIQAALEGMGAVVCSPSFVERELRRRALRRLAPDVIPAGDHYWLIRPGGTARPAVDAFTGWLLREAAPEGAEAPLP